MNDAPPPSATLLRAIADTKPVKTRVPLRELLLVLALTPAWGGAFFAVFRIRRDIPYLDMAWVVATAILWMAGILGPLVFAIMPRRGQVLPDARRAAVVAMLSALVLVGLCFAFPVMSEEHSRIPKAGEHLHWLLHCLQMVGAIAAVPLLAAVLVLRRVGLVGGWRLGASVGAASGAFAGLMLEMLCPIGGAIHVGSAHGGGVVLMALVGALLARVLF
jgi:hypothetical protein